ncbi:ATP synthase E chain-domain-containing protein, partial [Lentinula detonsa]
LQVARYSALFAGVFYGFYHRRTLQAAHNENKVQHAAHDREHLIAEAKEAWQRKQVIASSSDDVVTDPEDPRFDLEKLIAKWEKAT